MTKKIYVPLPKVADFIELQPEAVQIEYGKIINVLEEMGFLVFPYAEKVEKELFAIRLTGLKNIRVFYMYFKDNHIYGIHAYEKKTRKIPDGELKKARKILKLLRFPNE